MFRKYPNLIFTAMIAASFLVCRWLLLFYNDHAVHSIYVWPSTFAIAFLVPPVGLMLFFRKKRELPFSRLTYAIPVVVFVWINLIFFGWRFYSLPGSFIGSGEIGGRNFIVHHYYGMGWQDGDYEYVSVFDEDKLIRTFGFGGNTFETPKEFGRISPPEKGCGKEICELWKTPPDEAVFRKEDILLKFEDGSELAYPITGNAL